MIEHARTLKATQGTCIASTGSACGAAVVAALIVTAELTVLSAAAEDAKPVPTVHGATAKDTIPNGHHITRRLARAATYTNPIVPGDWSDPGVLRTTMKTRHF